MATDPNRPPSVDGIRRHPPNGYYDEPEYGTFYPCTCRLDCPDACKGTCGCKACWAAYQDALSQQE